MPTTRQPTRRLARAGITLAGSAGTLAILGSLGAVAFAGHGAHPTATPASDVAVGSASAPAVVSSEGVQLFSGSSAASPGLVFDNWNNGGVASRPTAPIAFLVSTRTHISKVATYHWNGGAGARPGTIWLLDSSARVVAGAQAAGSAAGVPKTDWVAALDVDLAPGLYSVTDSDQATWSHNRQSAGRGFARVWGRAVAAPAAPAPPPAPQPPTPTTRATSPFHGCGYTSTVALMDTCSASTGTRVRFMLARNLPAAVVRVDLTQADNRNLRPTNIVHVVVTGSSATAGSVLTFVAPQTLCFAGRYSRWHVTPAPASGPGYGIIGDITFTCS